MTEEQLKKAFQHIIRQQRAAEADALKDAPASRNKIESRDPVFMDALYAQAGAAEATFAKQMLDALQRGDVKFFETVIKAMKTTKAINSKKRTGLVGNGVEPSFAHHVYCGHLVLDRIETSGKPTPSKGELEKLITDELQKIDQAPYVDPSDWRKLWKVLGVSDARQNHVGRSKTYSGKGRTAKGWDA